MAVETALPRQGLATHPHRDPQQARADEQPQSDQGERAEIVDRELDEEVARTPHEPEREEEQPVGSGGRVGHW